MLDHVSIAVSDISAAERFHDAIYGAFLRDPDGNRIEAVCHIAT
jgi:catechol 2,3-dioxygenase-like lactoylglutathione lyase family enzyme